MEKIRQLNLKLSKDLMDDIELAAEGLGCSLTEFMRRMTKSFLASDVGQRVLDVGRHHRSQAADLEQEIGLHGNMEKL